MRLAGRGRMGGRRWHNAVVMWQGFEVALLRYADAVWRERRDRCLALAAPSPGSPEGVEHYGLLEDWLTAPYVLPDWIGIEQLHASHRGALLAQRGRWYRQFGWMDAAVRSMWWPAPLVTAGDRVLGPDGRLWWVEERIGDEYVMMLGHERRRATIHDVRCRVWQRAVEGVE